MNQLPANIDKISDIIKVLNGGIEFYKDGIKKVAGHNIQAMFNRMLEEKQQAVLTLQAYLPEQKSAKVSGNTDWSIGVRNMYTKLLGALNPINDHNYVKQLESVEDKVLAKINDALEEKPPQQFACELRRIRSRMQQCREELGSFHHATAIAG
ncbi:DUF2383 domain-containing protein [Salinimonas marina]|uniref:DUF2383 domain-containing protein n=1 Tax=Salinimonas marina TaxID=2785918 RepID=A0A7S9DZE6_9ALTE|nr:DUF2383 domain-containing protein [Salinimonas marina]QPG06732.1 DUF2383 domain-containing protein [Salinimonas marina]